MTTRQAAWRMVRQSSAALLPLTQAARLALVSELAVVAGRRDRLGPLIELAGAPGLASYLAERFQVLRRQGVSPQRARGALRATDGEQAGDALANLYREYLGALEKHSLIDDEGALSVATDLLTRQTAPNRLLIDLPLAVSPLEREFLKRAATFADRAYVGVAGDVAPGESRLPGAARLAERWSDLPPPSTAIPTPTTAIDGPPWRQTVRDRLFDDQATRSDSHAQLEVVAGASAQDTARRVAERVKRLLVADSTRVGDVVLATASLESTGPRYEEALRECGVPVASELAPRLAESRLASAALDLLDAVQSDWAFEPLLRLVSRVDGAIATGSSRTDGFLSPRAATEWLVRELQIPKGRAYLQRETSQLAQREPESPAMRQLVAAAKAASPVLAKLQDACERLPAEATPLEWLDATRSALQQLGCDASQGHADPRDHQAADALEEAAAAVESLAAWRGRAPRQISLREWHAQLRVWSRALRLPRSAGHEGCVRIVGYRTAIGLGCEHLFLVDASEQAFSAADSDGAEEQMLLFRELCLTPSRSLTLAYAALDSAAQPLSPSPMVTELERLFDRDALRKDRRALMQPHDFESAPTSPRAWRVEAAASAATGDATVLASYATRHGRGLACALTVVDERSRGDHFGEWEGVLASGSASRSLTDRYGADHLWSASQLELMATCPYKYFARQVLRMAPVGELALGVDYRRRGSLMHDALAECLTELVAQLPEGAPLSSLPEENLRARLVERINALAASDRLPAHEAALARIEARQASRWAERYAEQQAKYERDKRWSEADATLRPALLEARFGPATAVDSAEDAASTDAPLELRLPSGELLRVTGRIDRIDACQQGDRTLFTVVDYKTSRTYSAKTEHFESGKQVQPVLYALAAQRLFFDESAIPVGAGYWVVQQGGFVAPPIKELPMATYEEGVARPSDEWLATVDTVVARCEQLVREICQGAFPMHNDDEHCGARCEFRTICRVGQARSLDKTPRSEEAP